MKIYRGKCEELTAMGEQLYNSIKLAVPGEKAGRKYVDVTEYMALVYDAVHNGEAIRIYSKAIQAALDNNASVYIPYFDHPLYLNESIVLNSGNSLKVHPETRLVLIGDICMIHNRNVMDGHFIELRPGAHSDRDISISGGIWELPETVRLNYDPYRDYPGCDAGFVLHNVINVRMEDMMIRNTNRMGAQIGNCEGFLVQNIRFENAGRDGIHIEGPAAFGLIRNIEGRVGDDVIALNAWDWDNASLTFGAIHDVVVEDIECEPGYLWSEMRLHPGNKRLVNGQIIDCPLYNICFRNIKGVHTIKLYNQPNLMPGCQQDRSVGLGCMYNIFFEDITFDYFNARDYYTKKDACFEIISDIYNISFRNINFNYPLRDRNYSNYSAVAVGPVSATWKNSDNPDDWYDFYETDQVCEVDRIVMENFSVNGKPCTDPEKLLLVRHLEINPDYPKTTPKGGTGYGIVGELYISNDNS